MAVSFGQALGAAAVLTIGVALVEQYDAGLALGFAAVVLLAILFHNREAVAEIVALL